MLQFGFVRVVTTISIDKCRYVDFSQDGAAQYFSVLEEPYLSSLVERDLCGSADDSVGSLRTSARQKSSFLKAE
jgi:hypothetical protein